MSSFIAFHLKRILERAQAIYSFTVETKKLKWVFLRGLPLGNIPHISPYEIDLKKDINFSQGKLISPANETVKREVF